MQRAFIGLTLAWTLASGAYAGAQSASEADLRAAFVYNFAKFTEWPADAITPSGPIVLCVIDDAAVATALGQLVRGRTIGTHGLAVRRVKIDEELRTCHLLYAAGVDTPKTAVLLESVGASPVLTISDREGFAEHGGVANFLREDGRVRFVVNVESALRARLQVSSKLLTLAKLVKDSDARR
jgi:hypothetical protein